ncbi:MAG: hypothetical protein ACI9VR_000943 [Cognaticolwellia sp.]|jgi:hypothetical protein
MLLFALLGCGSPDHPELPELAPAPCSLELSDSDLDFGSVVLAELTEPVELSLLVSNGGEQACTLEEAELSWSAFDFSLGQWDSWSLAAGEQAELVVRYAPTGTSGDAGELSFVERSTGAIHRVQVRGRGLAPVLAVSAQALDFGRVDAGCSQAQSLTLQNPGNQDLVIEGFEFASVDAALSFVPDPDRVNGALPWTLAPGDSADVWVSYAPDHEAEYSALLSVWNSDPVRPRLDVAVSGQARIFLEQNDLFEAGSFAAFELSHFPVARTVSVAVGGQTQPTGWVYVPSTNTVDFDAAGVPAVGSEIEVHYLVTEFCGCLRAAHTVLD